MTADEKKALDDLQNLIIDSAKGKAEEFKVYQKAENIVKEHPVLATTVKTLIDKEISADFDIGENKQIGFMYNPEEKKAKLGFKMSFDEGGFLGRYQSKGTVTGSELTFQQAFKDRIAEMQRKLDAGGRMSQGEIDKANRTYVRLFGGTHTKRTYKSVLQDVFQDR